MLNHLYWLLLVIVSANTCTGPCETRCSISCPACIEKAICLEIVPLVEAIKLLSPQMNITDSMNATEALSILCLDIVPHSVFARTSYTVSCITDTCTPIICSRGACDGGGDTSCETNCDECAADTAICSITLNELEILTSVNITGTLAPLVTVVMESIMAMCSNAAIRIQWSWIIFLVLIIGVIYA